MKSSGAMILEVMNAILAIKTFLLVEISLLMEMLKAVYQRTTLPFLVFSQLSCDFRRSQTIVDPSRSAIITEDAKKAVILKVLVNGQSYWPSIASPLTSKLPDVQHG